MRACFALTPHYLSHTKTDGPIRELRIIKRLEYDHEGAVAFGLKLSEIEQTRRPGKLVNHRIQLEEIYLSSRSSRAVARVRFEGQCMHGIRPIYQVLKPVCN